VESFERLLGQIWQSPQLWRLRKVVEENLGINGDEALEATPPEMVCNHRETELIVRGARENQGAEQ